MNIPDFGTVLRGIIQHNRDLRADGASVEQYLIPMAWGDPGLGKTEIKRGDYGAPCDACKSKQIRATLCRHRGAPANLVK